ncbi:hypothetical protein K438DRAFT_1760427 [Mycena galopus ATCC 62051]|nr:hypothetical protein K438DRAFT_1760427 [Mycena galopus ATCC 62051]
MTCERAVLVESPEASLCWVPEKSAGVSGAGGRPGDKDKNMGGRGAGLSLFVPEHSGVCVGHSSAHRKAEGTDSFLGVGSSRGGKGQSSVLGWEGHQQRWRARGVDIRVADVPGAGERLALGRMQNRERESVRPRSMSPVKKTLIGERVTPGQWQSCHHIVGEGCFLWKVQNKFSQFTGYQFYELKFLHKHRLVLG